MTQVLENDKELYVTTNCNLLFENFSDKKAQKTIVNLIGLGILVNRYQSGSQSRDLDRSDTGFDWNWVEMRLEAKTEINVCSI